MFLYFSSIRSFYISHWSWLVSTQIEKVVEHTSQIQDRIRMRHHILVWRLRGSPGKVGVFSSLYYIVLNQREIEYPFAMFIFCRTTFGCIIGWCCSSCTRCLKFQRRNVISGRSLCTRTITNLLGLLSQIMITFHVKSFRFIVWNGGVAEWIIVIIKKMLKTSSPTTNEAYTVVICFV